MIEQQDTSSYCSTFSTCFVWCYHTNEVHTIWHGYITVYVYKSYYIEYFLVNYQCAALSSLNKVLIVLYPRTLCCWYMYSIESTSSISSNSSLSITKIIDIANQVVYVLCCTKERSHLTAVYMLDLHSPPHSYISMYIIIKRCLSIFDRFRFVPNL